MPSILKTAAAALLLATSAVALVARNPQHLDLRELGLPERRADPSLTGYLGAFFLGDEPDVYFYLSNGNDAISFKALNGGKAVITPSAGTGGVRDPAIVPGGGAEAGKKWYIVGTDLDIGKVCLALYTANAAVGFKYCVDTDHGTDDMGRGAEDRLAGDLRMGEHRPDQLDEREAR